MHRHSEDSDGACAQIAVFTFAYAANALLCLYSVAAWAQEIGTSWSVPFFRLNVNSLWVYPVNVSLVLLYFVTLLLLRHLNQILKSSITKT